MHTYDFLSVADHDSHRYINYALKLLEARL